MIWAPIGLPPLKLLGPNPSSGAVVLVDNAIGSTTGYKGLLAPLELPNNGYTNTTPPVQNHSGNTGAKKGAR